MHPVPFRYLWGVFVQDLRAQSKLCSYLENSASSHTGIYGVSLCKRPLEDHRPNFVRIWKTVHHPTLVFMGCPCARPKSTGQTLFVSGKQCIIPYRYLWGVLVQDPRVRFKLCSYLENGAKKNRQVSHRFDST